jgi:hypothetical protein
MPDATTTSTPAAPPPRLGAGGAGPSAAPAAHPLRTPRILLPLLAVIALVQLPFLHHALRGAPAVTAATPFRDSFDRKSLGNDYWSNGGLWRIVPDPSRDGGGQLYSPGVGNNPLWLKARLPDDVRIEFDVRSDAPDGDVKWEAFGDGRTHSTGYIFIFGGWHNRESRIAKLDEHALTEPEMRAQLAQLARPYPLRGPGGLEGLVEAVAQAWQGFRARASLETLEKGAFYKVDTPVAVKRTDTRVDRGRTYHVTVTRKGPLIRWENDGVLVLELHDPAPLSGSGHDRFGFSSWQNDTYFDNLKIEPL